jgi:hypothetical protein
MSTQEVHNPYANSNMIVYDCLMSSYMALLIKDLSDRNLIIQAVNSASMMLETDQDKAGDMVRRTNGVVMGMIKRQGTSREETHAHLHKGFQWVYDTMISLKLIKTTADVEAMLAGYRKMAETYQPVAASPVSTEKEFDIPTKYGFFTMRKPTGSN